MKFNTKKVTIRDVEFEIKELTIGQLMPIVKLMNDDAEAGQIELMAASIYMNDEPLGSEYENLPASMMMKLAPHVTEVNNLDDGEEEKL
tara:strand:+ start:273 stop:539 length:267 start_codon:yes stop_codon:yes gene_type:complete